MFEFSEENKTNRTVFVYGSLKRGYRNNAVFLENAKYLGPGQTMASHFDMFSIGLFPAATKNGNFALAGELYEVDEETLQALDLLESNGSLYRREVVQVVSLHDARFSATKEPVKAWIYFWMRPTSNSLGSENVFSYLGRNVMVKTWGLDQKKRAAAPMALQAEQVQSLPPSPPPAAAPPPAPSKVAEATAAADYDDDEDDDDDDDLEFEFFEKVQELEIKVMRMKV